MHTAIYFYYLLLLSSISFGSHFAKSSLSVFGLYMINDHTITPAGLGLLLSACSLPSMFIPLLVGHSVDKTKREIIITLVLFLFEIAGLTIFCSAVFSESFTLAVIALLIYGVGSSSISVIQRILVTLFLRENISFTTGFYVALANVAKMMGKVLVGPAVVAMGSYKEALILPIMGCVLSLLCYLLFHSSNDHGTIYINFIASSGRRRCNTEVEFHIHKGSIECTIPEPAEGSEVDPSETSPMMYPRRASVDYGSVSQDPMQMYEERLSVECEEPRTPLSDEARSPRSSPATTLPIAFYWMAGIHTLYILTFHALNNFLPHLLYSSYGSTAMEAGYISSIPFLVIIVLAPGMGFIVDRVGQRMLFCTATALMAVIAYTVLIYTDANPYLKMALISIPHGMIPVLTLAEISSLLPIASVGIAFGIVEVLDSVVNVLGNILFGWLYNVTGSYQTGMIVLLVFAWTGFVALVYMTIKEIVPQSRESIDRRVYDTDLVGM